MAQYRVAHSLVQYNDGKGLKTGLWGDIVEIPDDSPDLDRLLANDALLPPEEDVLPQGDLTAPGDLNPESGEEFKQWVGSATVAEISEYLAGHPTDGQRVLDAETARTNGEPRVGVVQAVEVAAKSVG